MQLIYPTGYTKTNCPLHISPDRNTESPLIEDLSLVAADVEALSPLPLCEEETHK